MPSPSERPLYLVGDHRGEGVETLLEGALPGHAAVRVCATLRETLEALAEAPALLLLDPLSTGGSAELGAIDAARGEDPPVPLLVVADRGREDAPAALVRSLSRGAWDLVWRDASPEEVRMRLQRLERTREDLAQVTDLRHRAAHDDRTDLLRPQAFEERLSEHFSAAQRHSLNMALILLDLDRFGQVNKVHDHTVGDRLISQVGEVIRRTLRTEDVAARLGGDEFAVLLPFTRKIDVVAVVTRLRDEIGALSGRVAGARSPIEVSASLGFETFDGADLDSVATLRAHAERALRVAKEAGGHQAVYFRGLERRRTDSAPAEEEVEL